MNVVFTVDITYAIDVDGFSKVYTENQFFSILNNRKNINIVRTVFYPQLPNQQKSSIII